MQFVNYVFIQSIQKTFIGCGSGGLIVPECRGSRGLSSTWHYVVLLTDLFDFILEIK